MVKDFWQGESCECCGGETVEKHVMLHCQVNGSYVLVENVPAGVCKACGTRYFAANTLKIVEESVHGRHQAGREELVRVYAL